MLPGTRRQAGVCQMLPELTSRLEFNTRCPISVAGTALESRHRLLCARPATNGHLKTARTRFHAMGISEILRGPTRMLAFQCSGERAKEGANPAGLLFHPWACRRGSSARSFQGPLRRALFLCGWRLSEERRAIPIAVSALQPSGREAFGCWTDGRATSIDHDRPRPTRIPPPRAAMKRCQSRSAAPVLQRARFRHRRRSPASATVAFRAYARRAAN